MTSKNNIKVIIGNLIGNKPEPTKLLQYLFKIQHSYSYIPEPGIRFLAFKLNIPTVQILGVIEFYAFLHLYPQGNFNILISDSITDQMLGSRKYLQQLCEILQVKPGNPRHDGRVAVNTTSCTGLSDQGPAMLVNGIAVTELDSKRITTISELVENNIPLEQWPKAFFNTKDNIRRSGPLLEKDMEKGHSLRILFQNDPDCLLDNLEKSNLRGRGGAGFKVSSKWRLCKNMPAKDRYVVCNADEGEPGTFKDRILLQSYADEIIEGMTLCAGIINAQKGFIYLRGEYFYLLKQLEETLDRRRQDGLLGNNILGQAGFDFDIDIHLGAGAYICGQESALLESLSGKRGIPLNRPPFPVTHGYLGKPTVLNNVETFIAAAKIISRGVQWFRAKGTEQSPGTKLISISGDCHYPGVYEYEFGTSIAKILQDCGAKNCQAVQISGAAGNTVPASEFERQISYQDLSTGGSFMVFNDQRDLLDVIFNFSLFFVHESCGFCTPCRVGTSLIKDLVIKLKNGLATSYDLDEIRNISKIMQDSSHCGLGHTAPNAILDILDKFPDCYRKRLKSTTFEPGFDLDSALSDARKITKDIDKATNIIEERL